MSRARRRTVKGLVVLGSVFAFLSVFAIWTERQALNTDDWVDTSGRMIQNEKIRSAVADFAFCWDGREYRLGVSIGVVQFSDARLSTQELVAAADRMCYVAKASGRNRVAVHDPRGVGDRDHDVSHRAGARREPLTT